MRPLIPRGLLGAALLSCGAGGARRGETVLFASGADLQSINPLLAVHPLARQVQRYVLLTTLVRYDARLEPEPYLARSWTWSADRRELVFGLQREIRWHDGRPTTANDVAWTLRAASDPATGYPRFNDLADLAEARVENDSTVRLIFRTSQPGIPDVLTDLAILPRHLLQDTPLGRMREAAWNRSPVGNGPYRFVRHDPNRRWVFARNADFPAALGGPPRLARLVLAVVDEPTTKLAALVSGELDFAGIQPAHAEFVRRDRKLTVLDYPLLFTYGLVLNTRRAPFDQLAVRQAIAAAADRREIVAAHVYGLGTPAFGPLQVGTADSGKQREGSKEFGSELSAGVNLPVFEILTAGSGEGTLEQLVQAQLARAGIRTRIRQLELSTFLARLYGPAHDFDAAILGIPGDLGQGYLRPLVELAGMSVSNTASALRTLSDSGPVVFLYHARGVQGANRRVRGVQMDLRGELPTVHDWWVEE
ncbi:MAG TPA: ABC transporter substrate-binding protein [Gemmatimonadales bacterium]|nr:ABC transporter substrate-binding protein [Gemmatimonadales bacterium]